MGKLIANENMILQVTPNGAWIPGDPNIPSGATLTLIKASFVEVFSSEVLVNNISWIMIIGACQLTGYNHKSGAGIMNSSAQFCKCDLQTVMRKDDEGTCIGLFGDGISPMPSTVVCTCKFKIFNAGQIKVKGE